MESNEGIRGGYRLGGRPSERLLATVHEGALCKAVCADGTDGAEMGWWHADPPVLEDIRKAQAVCAKCPVFDECNEMAELYAGLTSFWGVWAGRLWWKAKGRSQGRVVGEDELEDWCKHRAGLDESGEPQARQYNLTGNYAGRGADYAARKKAGKVRKYERTGKYAGARADYVARKASGDVRKYERTGKYDGRAAEYEARKKAGKVRDYERSGKYSKKESADGRELSA